MSYKHLSLEERHYIQLSMKKGLALSEIAQALERSTSTILRKVRRNTGQRDYRYQQANRMAGEWHQMKGALKTQVQHLWEIMLHGKNLRAVEY